MTQAVAVSAVLALSMTACARAAETSKREMRQPQASVQPATNEARPQSTADSQALAEFTSRLEDYVKLHNRLEGTLPKLSKETTPALIDTHQRALGDLIRKERSTAKRGDVFTPGTERVVKRLLGRVFGGPDGKQLKASIMDENPGDVKLAVNGRYPDEIPLSTVPPQVLASLPKLPDEVEYRFIGDRLILLDVHAHTIVDYIENALPA